MLLLVTQAAAYLAGPFRRRLAASGNERAASLIEYAFLVGLIAVVCLLAITFFGRGTSTRFSINASAIEHS